MDRSERSLGRKLNETEVPRHNFTRILGREPHLQLRNVQFETIDTLKLLTETFGPPERMSVKEGQFLFWNFARRDGKRAFSLLSAIFNGDKVNAGLRVTVLLTAKNANALDAVVWTQDRLGEIGNGEPPAVLNGARFALAPIQ